MRVLFFSSVCKSLEIFKPASKSFLELNKKGFDVDYFFLDDNIDFRTKDYLNQLTSMRSDVSFLDFQINTETEYTNHDWNSKKIDRVINIKNAAIDYAVKNNYDYLFLVDSDLVLHPNTLINLIESGKDFVFSIFWTKFSGDSPYTPNAWDYHSWNYYSPDSYYRLKKSGLHVVGGGGACTLLSKEILKKGLNFSRLASLNFPGEDRHFCTRAQSLGYDLYVDSRLPSYHIFHDHMAGEATEWYKQGASPSFFEEWLDETWVQEVEKRYEVTDDFVGKIREFLFDIRKSFKKIF